MKRNSKMSNINGLKFTVSRSGSGIQLVADEWYPCVLASITQDKRTYKGEEKDVLIWDFQLQGEEFQMELKTGEIKQFSIRGTTSLFASPKSKMYAWYTKLIGADVPEGGEIDLESILGRECFIMVEPKEYQTKEGETKTAFNLVRIKPGNGNAPVKPQAKPVVAPKSNPNPQGVSSPSQIPDDSVGVEEKPVSAVKKVFKKIDI